MTKEEKRELNRIKNIKWRRENKEKYLKCAAQYRKNNRKKIQDYKLNTRYGISAERYLELYQIQNGKCAICNNSESALHNSTKQIITLAVDHCHETKKVRGLLCQDCNRGLGNFHDDILRLEKTIKYLKINNI